MGKFYRSELTVSCESNNKSKSYIGVLLSIVVLLLISSMIVAAIVIISPEIATFSAKSQAPREAITLEEAFLHELGPNDFLFQWLKASQPNGQQNGDELLFEDLRNINIVSMPSRESLTKDPGGNSTQRLQRFPNTTKFYFQPKVTTLVSNTSLLSSIGYQGFKISPSKRYLLIWTNKKRQFRYTSTARYFIYDIKQDLITLLSTQPAGASIEPSSPAISNPFNLYENLDSATTYINNGPLRPINESQYTRFQVADWYSDGGERDSLVLIQNNDIYILNDVAGETTTTATTTHSHNKVSTSTRRLRPQQLTFTGKLNEIFNGVPDWLYEEEVLADTPAFQVSPGGKSLAYMSFNDSLVLLMQFPIYGGSEQIMPRIQQIRYPKVGRVNPTVSVHVIDNLAHTNVSPSSTVNDIRLRLPEDLSVRQHYINRIRWLTGDDLSLIWLNRNQNESFVLICSRQNEWKCDKNLHLSSPGGWLDMTDDPVPLNESHYLIIMPKFESPQLGSFKQLACINMRQPNSYTFITTGPKEVMEINGVDYNRKLVYFTGTRENEPGQRQVYVAPLETSEPLAGYCVTCSHHPAECLSNGIRLSPSTDYYVFECAGPGIPRTELRTTLNLINSAPELHPRGSKATLAGPINDKPQLAETAEGAENLIWTIEDNRELANKLKFRKVMPLTMRLKVPIPNTDYMANVILLLPPQLGPTTTFRGSLPASKSSHGRIRRSAIPRHANSAGLEQELHAHFTPESISDYADQLASGQQYPMVVDVYGGPGSQKVDYRFNVGFGHYLASSRRTIYAMIDGRGSGYQGTRRLFELYHKFGTVEIQDQIEVTNHLARNLSFIDASKVGIWGWSYGGYAAAMALAQSSAKAEAQLQQTLRELKLLNKTSSDGLATGSPSSEQRVVASTPEEGSQTSANAAAVMRAALSAQFHGVFECAASVAPVTSWMYYDTAYTERYMSSPYANELYDKSVDGDHALDSSAHSNGSFAATASLLEKLAKLQLDPSERAHNIMALTNQWLALNQTFGQGESGAAHEPGAKLIQNAIALNARYKAASLIEQVENINRKRFLLIHGTADDNVHFQQSVMLMKQLIRKSILYESRLYPDQDHGISNIPDKLHLGATLSNFFAECFDMAY